MPCKNAMIKNVFTIAPEATINDAFDKMSRHAIRALPVVDQDNVYLGMFSFKVLIRGWLPKSVTMERGLESVDFLRGSTQDIVERMKESWGHAVRDFMATDRPVLKPETVMAEALLLLNKNDMPLPVIDDKTGKLLGLFTEQEVIRYLLETGGQK